MRKINAPQINLQNLPAILQKMEGSGEMPSPVTDKGLYAHWDKVRYLTPPDGLTPEEYWQHLKFARGMKGKNLPFTNTGGGKFWFCQTEELSAFQHWIDKQAAGFLGAYSPQALGDEQNTRFLMDGQKDEAIHSSMLEGAVTTREEARKMLRRPKAGVGDINQRMVVNNYLAMEFIQQHKQESLSAAMILELHKIITAGTLENSADVGVFRSRDGIAVYDNLDNERMHSPPPYSELGGRMQQLCDFANDEKEFIHPALRAIILHFMLAYLHPFADGNGRTARALFYREMARRDYWLIPFVSISAAIDRARRQYYRAFVYTETDGNDLTYFLLHQANVIRKAYARLIKHISKQKQIIRDLANWEKHASAEGLNRRQISLLLHAVKHPEMLYTATGHLVRHHITHATAQSDLRNLAARGWLDVGKRGKEYIYTPRADLSERLKADE